ncbi:MAG: peptidoglycan DD-metalloendopeptidase family protein [Rhodospirillaceae bacterium]|nr:peptidoglycan DD-metalloendopeptidase family protein [Rhodospirillaceae bacterium]
MAKALWPGVSLCACAGALLGAATTFILPAQHDASEPLDTASAHVSEISQIQMDLAGIELAVRRVATAAIDATKTVKVKAGDTLGDVLQRSGVDRSVAVDIVEAIKQVYNPRRLQSGQALTLNFIDHANDRHLGEMSFETSPGQTVAVERADDGSYIARKVVAETHRETVRYDGTISSSLFAAAADAGVPDKVMSDMVSMFAYDVDFQRDIQEGDTFSVMFDRTVTKDGRVISNDGIKLASMTLSGSTNKLFAFYMPDGTVDFYNEKGEGIRKGLKRTPINGARLTSGFGARRHPILGYTKMHQGIDFGAPIGTPILAAGDGVIEKREVFGGYGNYIRIRHGDGYATAYAHLSRFGKNVQVGRRVKQDEIIGYVGTTGSSTGPHLHYEILQNSRQVNPMKVKFASSQKLEGTLAAKFREARLSTERQYAALAPSNAVAMLAQPKDNGANGLAAN